MKKRDLVSSTFWILVGVLFCIGAVKYRFIHLGSLGAGFFPFMAGMALICLSVIVLISAVSLKKEDRVEFKEPFFLERDSLKKLLLAIVALLVYAFALNYLGFLLATFLFMIFLLRFIERQRWVTIFITALATSVATHLLFKTWLQVQLPRGILGL